jgi:hypothetical protein
MNSAGEIFRWWLGLANMDEREMLDAVVSAMSDLLFADKGLISADLADQLAGRGVDLTTPPSLSRTPRYWGSKKVVATLSSVRASRSSCPSITFRSLIRILTGALNNPAGAAFLDIVEQNLSTAAMRSKHEENRPKRTDEEYCVAPFPSAS